MGVGAGRRNDPALVAGAVLVASSVPRRGAVFGVSGDGAWALFGALIGGLVAAVLGGILGGAAPRTESLEEVPREQAGGPSLPGQAG